MNSVHNDETHALAVALAELREAVAALYAPTFPSTPMPRPRTFRICKEAYWPLQYYRGFNPPAVEWSRLGWRRVHNSYPSDVDYINSAEYIINKCGGQPALVNRATWQLEAAAAWCRARAAGRQRAAEEIIRQQSRAMEELTSRAALDVLGGLL